MIKYWEFGILVIYIIARRIFLNNLVFFLNFYLHFLFFFILERRQLIFFGSKILKK